MDKAASRKVRISFEASLLACFAAASEVVEEAGCVRGRIFTASWDENME